MDQVKDEWMVMVEAEEKEDEQLVKRKEGGIRFGSFVNLSWQQESPNFWTTNSDTFRADLKQTRTKKHKRSQLSPLDSLRFVLSWACIYIHWSKIKTRKNVYKMISKRDWNGRIERAKKRGSEIERKDLLWTVSICWFELMIFKYVWMRESLNVVFTIDGIDLKEQILLAFDLEKNRDV